MRFRIDGTIGGQYSLFLGGEGDLDLLGDVASDLFLEAEDVAQVAVVAIRPEVGVGSRTRP